MDIPGRPNIVSPAAILGLLLLHVTLPPKKSRSNQKLDRGPQNHVEDFHLLLSTSFLFPAFLTQPMFLFLPLTSTSFDQGHEQGGWFVLTALLESTLYQALRSPLPPASISPAAAKALSPVDGSHRSLSEPPCSPQFLVIHLYTLHTDRERRAQIKKDRFLASSLLLMSLLLSHLLSLFFC